MQSAVDLLLPMADKDNTDFVRQGALMALGMVLVQHNNSSSKVCRECLSLVSLI